MSKNKKKILVGICVVTFMLCMTGVHLFWVQQTPAIPAKVDDEIRIVSYNLKNAYSDIDGWQERKLIIAEQVLAYAPDSVGFQEADAPWMGQDGWDSGLPQLLVGYDFVGQSREDSTGEFCPIFYKADKYEVIDSGTLWLSDTPNEPSLTWGSQSNHRIVTYATLKNKLTGESYTHYNTHFDHESTVSRDNATSVLIEMVSRNNTSSFITGDFNFWEGTKNYQKIVESFLADSKKEATQSMSYGTINWYTNINTKYLPVIDFVFYSQKDFVPTAYYVDNRHKWNDKPVSDHFAIIADFKISY